MASGMDAARLEMAALGRALPGLFPLRGPSFRNGFLDLPRMTEQNFTIKHRPGVATKVRLDDAGRGRHQIRLQQSTAIPTSFLDRLAAQRNAGGRAPMGDSHGAYQKVAEIPLALLFEKIPPDQWEDQKALAKLLNDPDLRKFRTDGLHRRF